GTPGYLTPQSWKMCGALIEESTTFYLDEIVDYLAVIPKTHLSITALHNDLRALGLTYKHSVPAG
ncbi:hypothetical protein BS17DRAFT_715067, partial [Gyrodon lividus]